MELIPLDLILPYAAEVLGCAAAAATLLTFAQKRMWPMRISAIAANLFFIGYGALGQLYPVLFLHLILLPLNVVRLVQLAQQTTSQHTDDPEPPRPILVPQPLPLPRSSPPFGLGDKPSPVGARGARPTVWDLIRPAPP
jgi:hypothetical protein